MNLTTHNPITCPYVKSNMWYIEYLTNVYIANCVLNGAFAMVAIVGNSIVLYAVYKTPTLHKPSTFLLCNLAITDLAVGLLVQPLYTAYKITEMSGIQAFSCYSGLLVNMFANLFSGMSFITVTCICVDRYLALFLHLRYATVVTSRRVFIVLMFLWVFSSLVVTFYPWKVSIAIGCGIVIVITCLTVSSLTFLKINSIVRKHKRQIRQATAHNHTTSNLQEFHLPKYLKSVFTIGYVHILMFICYLPYMLTLSSRLVVGITKEYKLALNITTTIIYINSAINPALHSFRVREFRAALLRVIGRKLDQNAYISASIAKAPSSSEPRALCRLSFNPPLTK
ncbi:adenosine receptor A3-like [Exaiptasia diaphana]|uniref:G-protein coupled receptors family 1 profile domain-containing protein n=1 Tax=Exaiptasia diaphana TaxID=2652724 RepID=A0A913XAC4_EXADI|nr:adenosine receptor A3-like [Exaiptasia diaphana]